MKTIGLLGGLTYISTIEYYKRINEKINAQMGKSNSAKIILNSINYQEIKQHNYQDWVAVGGILKREIQKLDSFGVDCMLICNNTVHKSYGLIKDDLQIKAPFFHIVDAVGEFAQKQSYKNLLLLGTKFTMDDGFYQDILQSKYDMNVAIPGEEDRLEVNRIIQQELTFGTIHESSRQTLLAIIEKKPYDAVILGCTELPILLKQKDTIIPVLDTVEIHCNKVLEFALK